MKSKEKNYIKRSFNTHYCDLMEEFLPLRQLLSKKMYIYQNSRDHHLRADLLSCITLYTLLSAAFFPMSTPSVAPNLLYKMLRMLWLQLRIPDYKPIYPNSTCWRQQLKAEIPNSNFTAHCTYFMLFPVPCVGVTCRSQRLISWKYKLVTWCITLHLSEPVDGAFALMIVSSLCLTHSESLYGFCHFHLNCNSHCWRLLFHFHSFPACLSEPVYGALPSWLFHHCA